MNVSEGCAGIRMTELLLCDFRRVSRVDDEASDAVTERMKPAAGNVECVEDRPELILHDLVARRRPTVPSGEQKPLRIGFPFLLVLTQNRGERARQRDRRRTGLALRGLNFPLTSGATDVDTVVIEVDVRPLKS